MKKNPYRRSSKKVFETVKKHRNVIKNVTDRIDIYKRNYQGKGTNKNMREMGQFETVKYLKNNLRNILEDVF